MDKVCNKCFDTLPLSEFSTYVRKGKTFDFKYCKGCQSKIGENHYQRYRELYREIPVFIDPNTYSCDEDKELVFELMHKFGWIFDEETKIWYKPGVKNIDGNWVKGIESDKRDLERYYGTITDELIDKIIEDKRHNVRSYLESSKRYGLNYRELTQRIKKKTKGIKVFSHTIDEETQRKIKQYHKKYPKVTKSKIAQHFGVIVHKVYEILPSES